ncbi:MAG: 3-deoxy-D-manno-octulosonic acid transferase [Opitutales bacterium]
MILLYRLLFLPALVLALPYYLLRMWRRGGYSKDFQHRFGWFRRLPPPAKGKTRIWLQAVSVGEVQAVGPLIRELLKSGRVEIVLTTTTSTGYVEARKRYADEALAMGIFPLDFWLFSRLAWKRIQPDVIILTDSELWPEHLHQAKKSGVPTYLVNGRMSDRSFRRYVKVPSLVSRLLGKFNAVFAASGHDADRFEKLGLESDRIHRTGSIKLDVNLPESLNKHELQRLQRELGFTSTGEAPIVLLGSSTWPGEEKLLIQITAELRKMEHDVRLLLVPRHAERGPELKRLLEEQNLDWHQRSTGIVPEKEVIIHLADTTGEVSRLAQAADIAFIGKSLEPNVGGQNPIEAAGLGIPVLFGPNMSNFKLIAKDLTEVGAARLIHDGPALANAIKELVMDTTRREEMSESGRNWLRRSRGSSQRIAQFILNELSILE